MSEQDMLLEKARENLKAARLLIQDGLANIAASRAYYALITSQDIRQTGDYGVEGNVSMAEASQVVAWAEEFLIAAEAYLRQ